MTLHLLPSNTNGKCLDGTPGGYYFESASLNGDNTLWVIFLQGGGFCNTYESCKGRTKGHLGSSNYFPKTMSGASSYSTDKQENPDFYNGNHVFIPYCSGDVHSGQITQNTSATFGFYFSGHLIFEAVINELISKYNLNNAKNILLSGSSAGGSGTFVNIQWLSRKLNAPQDVILKAAPQAGWFFAGNCTDEQNLLWAPPNDYPHWVNGTIGGFGHDDSTYSIWDSYVDQVCSSKQKSGQEWHCMSVHVLYPYITVPIFVLENQFDKQQIGTEFLMPGVINSTTEAYVAYIGENMKRSMNQVSYDSTLNKNGIFMASCFDHVSGIGYGTKESTTIINGYNVTQLIGDWFWERNKYPHIIYDNCVSNNGLPCNPTCNGFSMI